MDLLVKILDHAQKTPDKVALSDCRGTFVTYHELDILSGRVYRYLKDRGIGREDFVNILLPRGVEPFIAMLGVWKAGAAFVMLEEGYPAERVEYIQKDCGCKLVLDRGIWAEIMGREPLPGYEAACVHDAAFAVYTSGSTGNPKGVLHEYGNIDRIHASLFTELHAFGLISPLYFVASVIFLVSVLHGGGTLFVIPGSFVKDLKTLLPCFTENHITEAFCLPSIYHLFSQIPSLRTMIVSSEPAYGIWSENPNLSVYNGYAMSESGAFITSKKLETPNEITPIGTPVFDRSVTLLTESGSPAADGEVGELCFENPFVRGYIGVLMADFERAMRGEPLPEDCYYSFLLDEHLVSQTSGYEEAYRYFKTLLGDTEWCNIPRPDFASWKPEGSHAQMSLALTGADMTAAEGRLGASANVLCVTACALAMQEYSCRPDILINWINENRTRERYRNTVGLLFKILPVAVHMDEYPSTKALVAEVKRQTEKGFVHSSCDYMEMVEEALQDSLEINYLPALRMDGERKPMDYWEVEVPDRSTATGGRAGLYIYEQDGSLIAVCAYQKRLYAPGSMERFLGIFKKHLHAVVLDQQIEK